MIKRKLLTIEDLVHFCQNQHVTKFNSKQSGYQLAVQIPTMFSTEDDTNDNHRGMIKLKFRIFHAGLNRNGSYISKVVADEAAPTISDRPILAAIHQLDDGSWDFEAHNMEVVENENGEKEINYIEKQIGSFSSENPFWEHDDELDKDYLCAYGYISEEYTMAADIIRAKDGWTKNSCELTIENLSYNAKEKYLELKKFYVSASTLLGSRDDGTKIEEGMLGSRADLVNFSTENNSICFETDESLKAYIQNSVKEIMKNINTKGKEEQTMEFEENVEVTETSESEEIVAEEAATAEEEVVEGTATEESTEEVTVTEAQSEESTDVTPSADEKFTKTFELSHSDIRSALYVLLEPFEAQDNEWYWIEDVYDDHFVYSGCNNIYDQKYTRDGDNITFDGERVHMNVEYLTDSELVALNEMRSNYAKFEEVQAELDKYHAEPEKMQILESEDYSVIAESEEFVAFKAQDAHFDLSADEVKAKADEMLLAYAKSHRTGDFAAQNKPDVHAAKPIMSTGNMKLSRYGGLGKKKSK